MNEPYVRGIQSTTRMLHSQFVYADKYGNCQQWDTFMIEQKKELATNIIPSGEQLIVNLSTEQLRDIFSLSSSAVSE